MAVAMRAGALYFFNSEDGLHYTEVKGFSVQASLWANEAPTAVGLFDPSLVQLPDGTILMYVTAGSDTKGVVVAATIVTE